MTQADEAVVELLVGVHEARRNVLRRNALTVPPRVRIRVQIDTGAESTAIDGSILGQLGIQPIDSVRLRPISVSAETVQFPRFAVSLGLPSEDTELHLPSAMVLGCHMTPEDSVQGVLGRDVLDHCLFVYDGRRRVFTIAF
jgi:hypothetical protein